MTAQTAKIEAIDSEYQRRKKDGTLSPLVDELLTRDFKKGVPQASA